jgi:hypothetical protein
MQAVNCPTSATTPPLGLVVLGNGTTGSASIAISGLANCVFDGASVAGNWVIPSGSVAGDCSDGGSYPSTLSIGRAMTSNASPATSLVDLTPNNSGGTVPPTVNQKPICVKVGTDDAASALVSTNLGPQTHLYEYAARINIYEITVTADAGTPNIQIRKNHGGTTTNLLSAVLATGSAGAVHCARTTTSATCNDGSTSDSSVTVVTASNANLLAAGDWLELTSGTPGGTAKTMTICVHGVMY